MAFGVKYISQFRDYDGVHKEVRLSLDGFSDTPIEWICKSGGIDYDYGDSDALIPGNTIIGSTARIGFVFEQLYDLKDLVLTRKTVKVEVVDLDNSIYEWTGWLEPWDATHPYHQPGFEVSMVATCGLSHLSRTTFDVAPSTSPMRFPLEEVHWILGTIGTGLNVQVSVHTLPMGTVEGMNPLLAYKDNTNRFYDGSKRLKCDQVLQNILNKFSAEIFQDNNVWVIRSIPDAARGYTGYWEYAPGSLSPIITVSSEDLDYEVNTTALLEGEAATLEGATLRITPPVNKYVAEANLNPRDQALFNGDLRLWDGNTFPGWDLTHMPNGNPGWQHYATGLEESPHAIWISGNGAFNQYGGPGFIQRKRKNWFKWVNVFVEPEYYIQTAIGTFNPGHNEITVSFDYYSGKIAFGAIAILLIKKDGSETYYIKEDGSYSDTWYPQGFGQFIKGTGGRGEEVKKDITTFSITFPIVHSVYQPRNPDRELYFDKISVRFYYAYPSEHDDVAWYRIFNVRISTDQTGTENQGTYRYELSKNAPTDDEGETINFLTGDYSLGFAGTTFYPDELTPTAVWARAGKIEQISIYKASLLDRLSLTWEPKDTLEGDLFLLPEQKRLRYRHVLRIPDLGGRKFKIVRLGYSAADRVARVTAIELLHNEPPEADLKTSTYVNGKSISGDGGTRDGVYPGENKPGNNNEQVIPPGEEEEYEPMFGPISPVYFVVGKSGANPVNLEDFFTDFYRDPDVNYDFSGITITATDWPLWLSVGVSEFLISLSGKPNTTGQYSVNLNVEDLESGQSFPVRIPVIVLPATEVTYTLTPGGKLSQTTPKQLPYSSAPYNFELKVTGEHDAHRITLKGGGVNLDLGLVEHGHAASATYTPFANTTLQEGIVDWAYIHYIKARTDVNGDPVYIETHRSRVTIIHGENLGDSDPNRRAVINLLSSGASLAEITGTETILKYLEAWNLTVSPVGILAAKFVVTISPEEEPYYKEMVPNRTDVTGSTTAVKLNPADGTTTADPGYNTTDPIPVTTGDRIWIYGNNLVAVGYNAGAYVDEIAGPEITIPAGVTHIRVCSQDDPVKVERVVIPPGEFQLFPSDTEKPAGRYSVFLRAFDESGEEVYTKFGKFQILEKEKEVPVAAGGLKLITEGASVSVVAELPVTGGVYPLPSDGFDVLHDVTDTEVDKITWEAFHLVNGGWQAINIPLYTGFPAEIAYAVPVTEATIQAFGAKTSLQIGDIHATGRFLFRFTDWLLGEKVGVSESDFRLKPNTPVGPDSGMAFAYFYPASDSFAIEDESLPSTGGYYPFEEYTPEQNRFWSVYFETFDGVTPYNRLVTDVDGSVAQEWSGAYTTTYPDAMASEYYIWGNLVNNKRIVGGKDIDVPGIHTVIHKFYDGTTLLGQKEVTLELYEDVENPEPIDPSECCEGNLKTIGNQTKEGTLTFLDPPIVPDAVAGNQAVNLDQVTDLIVAVTGQEIPFTTPSEEWLWMHNQNRKPVVKVVVGGYEVNATVQYLDNDTLKVVFTKPQTGSILIR